MNSLKYGMKILRKTLIIIDFQNSEKIKFNTIWDKVSETIVSETNPIDIVQINSLSDDVLTMIIIKKVGM